MQIFTQLLHELGSSIELDGLVPDEDGFCSLRFDGNLTLDMGVDEDTEALTISSILGEIPEERLAPVSTKLLEANLCWGGTGGSTLGVDPPTRTVVMAWREPIRNLDGQSFQMRLKGFIESAEYWQKQLTEVEEEEEEVMNALPAPELAPVGNVNLNDPATAFNPNWTRI